MHSPGITPLANTQTPQPSSSHCHVNGIPGILPAGLSRAKLWTALKSPCFTSRHYSRWYFNCFQNVILRSVECWLTCRPAKYHWYRFLWDRWKDNYWFFFIQTIVLNVFWFFFNIYYKLGIKLYVNESVLNISSRKLGQGIYFWLFLLYNALINLTLTMILCISCSWKNMQSIQNGVLKFNYLLKYVLTNSFH